MKKISKKVNAKNRAMPYAASAITLALSQLTMALDVPNGANLNSYTATNGTEWVLLGNAYLSNGSSTSIAKALPATFTLTGAPAGSTIKMSDGLAHYGYFSSGTATVNLSDVVFKDGRGSNGGVFSSSGILTLNISGNVAFSGNTATNVGGALYASNLIMTGVSGGSMSITGNSAVLPGGAVRATSGSITFNGSYTTLDVSENQTTGAQGGGAFYIPNGGGSMNIAGSYGNIRIDNNSAGYEGGAAAIYNKITINPVSVVHDVSLSGNTARGHSGGVFYSSGANAGISIAPITVGGSLLINGNEAKLAGGAFYTGRDIMISGSYGGDISIADNIAGTTGGAFLSGAGISIDADVNGSLFITGNHANNGTGGAFNAGSTIMIDGNYGGLAITGNQATGNGGALKAGSDITISGRYGNIDISNNSTSSATANGGAFYSDNDIGMNIISTNVNITNNIASGGHGGALYAAKSINYETSGITNITDNTAAADGGAIYAGGNTTVTSSSEVDITGNTAENSGGAIYSVGDVSLQTGVLNLENNTATTKDGGAIYAGENFTLAVNSATTISNNTAGGNGGAIFAGKDTSLSAVGGDITFMGNTSATGANAIYLNNTGGNSTTTIDAGSNTITFYDPIASNTANGLVTVVINPTGTGMVSFDGSKYSNTFDLQSTVYGTTVVENGVFEVANGAIYGVTQAEAGGSQYSSFTVMPSTTVMGGVISEIHADNLIMDGAIINLAGRQQNTRSSLKLNGAILSTDGATIQYNTYLDDGSSQNTDLLVVQGASITGSASVIVTNIGGPGAITPANGIRLVQMESGASSNDGAFTLGARVTSGIYEYEIYHHGVKADANDGHWYLRTLAQPDGPVINPESTVYLRSLNAASTMFMHTLHDRLGELQFTDSYKTKDNKPSSAWVRVVSNHTNSTGGNGQVDLNTNTNLVHLGTDIARWSNDGDDRWILGIMGAYGQSKIDASAKVLSVTPSGFKRNASGKVEGYSVGAYATWYGNKGKPEGAYVDTWAQYGWYDNKVQGNTQREESYNSNGWTASVEAGYALIARDEGHNRQWIFEPQVQVAYNSYSSDDHTDERGTRISDNNADGVITRVGARLYGRGTQNDNGVQPFVEANWWYSDAKNSLSFNGETMSDGTPNSRYELKAGLQGEIAKNWLMWGHAGVQFGEHDYNRYEGMVGIKRMF